MEDFTTRRFIVIRADNELLFGLFTSENVHIIYKTVFWEVSFTDVYHRNWHHRILFDNNGAPKVLKCERTDKTADDLLSMRRWH